VRQLIRDAGWKYVFWGWIYSISWRIIPSSAIGFLVYELALKNHNQQH